MEWMKGAIFDLDGTLIDSTGVWQNIDIDFLGMRGFEVPDDYAAYIAPLGAEETARYTKKRFGLSESVDDIIKEWYDMALDAYSYKIRLKPGVRRYLKYLKDRKVKISIATASDLRLVLPVLKNNKILDLFENITTIKEVTRGKGFPDIYIKSADKMALKPEECVVFEDIIQGIKGAKSGGFYTVGVHDEGSYKDKEAIVQHADKYIMDFEELLEGKE